MKSRLTHPFDRTLILVGLASFHSASFAQSDSVPQNNSADQPASIANDCDPKSVCGSLIDSNQSPVPFAQIEIEFEDHVALVTTSETGRFETERAPNPKKINVIIEGDIAAVIPYQEFINSAGNIVIDNDLGAGQSVIIVKARAMSQPFARRTVSQLDVLTNPIANADALLAVAGLASATNLDNSADVQLRGSAAGLSRVYYNDVPLYEVVRGSAVDRVTRVASILSSSILRDVETYASLPPSYLANSAAGAIRINPQVEEDGPNSLFVGLPGISVSSALDLKNGAAQIYGNAIDLSGLLAVNPKLGSVTDRFRSIGIGSAARFELGDGIEINTLSVFDYEDAAYPLELLNLSGLSENERTRLFTVIGAEIPFGDERLKIDSAFTTTRNKLAYLDQSVKANNVYIYANADMAGDLPGGIGEYRVGLTGESFGLNAAGTLSFEPEVPVFRKAGEAADYFSAFAFLTFDPLHNLKIAFGTRQSLSSRPDLPASYSLSATLSSSDRQHRMIAGIGRYAAILPPEIVTINPVVIAKSEQISLDYEFTRLGLEIRLGGYLKRDSLDKVVTDITGLDASINWQAASWLNLLGSVAHSRQISNDVRGDLDLDYIIRLQARTRLTETLNINISFTAKSGARYTGVINSFEFAPGLFTPIFRSVANTNQLEAFQTVDLNLVKRLNIGLSGAGTFAFVGVTNLLDRRNEARPIYTNDFSSESRALFERRAITFGISHSF